MEPKNVIPDGISDNVTSKMMQILNMVLPIQMHFRSFVSKWTITSYVDLIASKPDFIACKQQWCRPTFASAKSDQHLFDSLIGKYNY